MVSFLMLDYTINHLNRITNWIGQVDNIIKNLTTSAN